MTQSELTPAPAEARVAAAIKFEREALPPLAELERQWRALEAAARPSFFISWAWIGSMLAAIPAARRPDLLRGRAQSRTVALALLGAAATRRRHGVIRARGLYLNETGDPRFDAMTIEHNGVLTTSGSEVEILDPLLAWFAGRRGEADELHLAGALQPLPQPALATHRLLSSVVAAPSYSIDLNLLAAGDGALDPVLSANARQQLRRAFRHFEAQGPLGLSEASTEAEAQSWFGAMKALHCASWARRGKAHAFSHEFFEPFHRRLIERNFAEGAIQLLEIRAGERIIAYLYNFRHDGRVYAYQSGFADANPRERPGVVAHALAIRHACRSGLRVYDFMAGRNRLKESFATSCEPMLWQVAQQPRLRFRLEHLARRLKQRIVRSPGRSQ